MATYQKNLPAWLGDVTLSYKNAANQQLRDLRWKSLIESKKTEKAKKAARCARMSSMSQRWLAYCRTSVHEKRLEAGGLWRRIALAVRECDESADLLALQTQVEKLDEELARVDDYVADLALDTSALHTMVGPTNLPARSSRALGGAAALAETRVKVWKDMPVPRELMQGPEWMEDSGMPMPTLSEIDLEATSDKIRSAITKHVLKSLELLKVKREEVSAMWRVVALDLLGEPVDELAPMSREPELLEQEIALAELCYAERNALMCLYASKHMKKTKRL